MKKNILANISPLGGIIVTLIFLFAFASCQAHTQAHTQGTTSLTCEASPARAPDVALLWDASTGTGPKLVGYKIHYRIGLPGPPFDGTGIAEGDSPILLPLSELRNPDQPEYRTHGLSKTAKYFFVVTAFDANGHESDYSNCVYISPAVSKASK